jgi:hypothetical protein
VRRGDDNRSTWSACSANRSVKARPRASTGTDDAADTASTTQIPTSLSATASPTDALEDEAAACEPAAPGTNVGIDRIEKLGLDGETWSVLGWDIYRLDLATGDWTLVVADAVAPEVSNYREIHQIDDGLFVNSFEDYSVHSRAGDWLAAGGARGFTRVVDDSANIWSPRLNGQGMVLERLSGSERVAVPTDDVLGFDSPVVAAGATLYVTGSGGDVFRLEDGEFVRAYHVTVVAGAPTAIVRLWCEEPLSDCRLQRVDLTTDEVVELALPAGNHDGEWSPDSKWAMTTSDGVLWFTNPLNGHLEGLPLTEDALRASDIIVKPVLHIPAE